MPLKTRMNGLGMAAAVASGLLTTGCASLIAGSAADTLSAAILNQTDPAIVESGAPAYLLLLDGLVYESPDNASLLAAAAQLYAVYGALFAADADRAQSLTGKARDYGQRALCASHAESCQWDTLSYDEYVSALDAVKAKRVPELFAYAIGWLSNLQATSSEWGTVADLPRVESALDRIVALDNEYQNGAAHLYLGVLHSLRPPALGGKPDVACGHFEQALALSEGKDLSAKVEFARSYARLVYDRELHDRLLTEVIEAPAEADGFTLFNVLAKTQAEELLKSGEDYF